MKKIDVEQLKQNISVESLIGRSYELTKHGYNTLRAKKPTKGAWHGELIIDTSTNLWVWYGRTGKNGRELGGSVIDWYMMMNGCDFRTAVQELGGGSLPKTATPVVKPKPQPQQGQQWRDKANRRVQVAQSHLQASHPDAVNYLTNKRALDLESCTAWGVGFDPMVYDSRESKAIMFPYYSADGEIIGLRYRWIEPVNNQKSTALKGSKFSLEFGLYHLWNKARGSTTLFVVEGEMNALSIIQCGYDAVSVGSESAKITDRLVELSSDYHNVIAWMDKSKNAAVNAKRLGANAIKSPHGLDANDLLQNGLLADFLEEILKRSDHKEAE